MRFTTLSEWLTWQENLHFTEIDPGLDRLGAVWKKMGGERTLPCKVVTVAGTNGKGSTVALTAAILRAAGYNIGTYTSPHLLRYNERISINGQPLSDDMICQAFDRIDKARGDISLTYFEFATLSAVSIFLEQKVDVIILEVGMGGRLDAVNLFNCDVAVITPIGLDHIQWLGDTREKIGVEKAGIMRAGKPVVLSETHPPSSVKAHASELKAKMYIAGDAYRYHVDSDLWHWYSEILQYENLPFPALLGEYQLQNSAAVIQICCLLNAQGLSISENAIRQGLQRVSLSGRFQVFSGETTRILDVTHNQQGAENLRVLLQQTKPLGKTFGLLAMLRDKDAAAVVSTLSTEVDTWCIASLDGSRGMTADELESVICTTLPTADVMKFDEVSEAYHQVMSIMESGDRVLIFGSFHTVEAVMRVMPEFQSLETVSN